MSEIRAFTDDEGVLRFPRLPAGRCRAYCLLGGRARGEVEPGEETDLHVEIPRGTAIEGVVVDAHGDPAPEADIFLGDQSSMSGHGMVVARADARGRFRLPSVLLDGWRQLGARKAGHAPSPLHTLLGTAGSTLEVRLQLGGPGGAVRGRVLRPDGTPVAGALVVAGSRDRRQFQLQDGSNASTPAPVAVRTGAAGRFRVDGLAPGEQPVLVRTREYALWEGSVDVVEGAVRDLRVVLGRGVVLAGRVRDEDGRPVRAEVVVGDYGPTRIRARAAEDGTFRLEGLAPGEIEAQVRAEGWRSEKLVFAAGAGEEVHRDVVLRRGPVLRGRVVDERGEPLAKWRVEARWFEGREDGQHDWKRASTDEEGSFEMTGCRDVPYDLEVRRGTFAAVKLTDIRPSGPELRIEVPDDAMATCHVKGRVIGPEGEPFAGARVTLFRRDAGSSPVQATELDGGFAFGPVPPGDYQVGVDVPSLPEWRSERRMLVPDETWDLGAIQLDKPGSLEVRIVPVAGFVPKSTWVKVRKSGSQRGPNEKTQDGRVRFDRLAPGRHVVKAGGEDVATVQRTVEIRAGEVTEVTVAVAAGVRHLVQFVPRQGAPLPDRVDVVVRDPEGHPVNHGSVLRYDDRLMRYVVGLAPGSWHVEATADNGLRGTLELIVPETATGDQTPTLVLH